jgi:hypothetical protein
MMHLPPACLRPASIVELRRVEHERGVDLADDAADDLGHVAGLSRPGVVDVEVEHVGALAADLLAASETMPSQSSARAAS